jgi:hypothetical protein
LRWEIYVPSSSVEKVCGFNRDSAFSHLLTDSVSRIDRYLTDHSLAITTEGLSIVASPRSMLIFDARPHRICAAASRRSLWQLALRLAKLPATIV